jgi:tetratricopeptide (TPR) repeat protein
MSEQQQTLSLQQAIDLGVQHHNAGDLTKAEGIYNQILQSNPDQPIALHLLGVVAHQVGKNDTAVDLITKAIAIKPDYATAHNNLGSPKEAVTYFREALEVKPDFAEAHYNLHALLLDPDDLAPSIKCMERAVEVDLSNTKYRFVLGMLWDYSGDAQRATIHFDIVENGKSFHRAKLDAWRYIKCFNNNVPPIIGSSIQAFKLGIDAAVVDGLVLEFGVRFGTSIRQIAALVDQDVHGFDSFQGLPESWHHEPKGSYSTKGVIPFVPENVTLHDGWFEETLPEFVKKIPGTSLLHEH